MDEQKDPLDELRHMAAGGTGVAKELRRIADEWRSERIKRDSVLDNMQGRYCSDHLALVSLCADYQKLITERDELKAKLSTYRPPALDADGKVIKLGDTVWSDAYCSFDVYEIGYADNGAVKVYQDDHVWALAGTVTHVIPLVDADGDRLEVGMFRWDTAHEDTVKVVGFRGATVVCELPSGNHVTITTEYLCRAEPKPETIEDVRGDISNDTCGYFGKGSATSCDGCPRDGKGGGCSRAMSADLVRRAYECGKRDGGDDE